MRSRQTSQIKKRMKKFNIKIIEFILSVGQLLGTVSPV